MPKLGPTCPGNDPLVAEWRPVGSWNLARTNEEARGSCSVPPAETAAAIENLKIQLSCSYLTNDSAASAYIGGPRTTAAIRHVPHLGHTAARVANLLVNRPMSQQESPPGPPGNPGRQCRLTFKVAVAAREREP